MEGQVNIVSRLHRAVATGELSEELFRRYLVSRPVLQSARS